MFQLVIQYVSLRMGPQRGLRDVGVWTLGVLRSDEEEEEEEASLRPSGGSCRDMAPFHIPKARIMRITSA